MARRLTDLESKCEKAFSILSKNLPCGLSAFKRSAVIAGGCIASWYHGQQPRDVDVFLTDHGILDTEMGTHQNIQKIRVHGLEFNVVAKDLGSTAEEIVNTFDFLHCCGYWTYLDGLQFVDGAMDAIKDRKLMYRRQNCIRPAIALVRYGKFRERGYEAADGVLEDILNHAEQVAQGADGFLLDRQNLHSQ